MLAAHGAHILSADDLARSLMQPGTEVFAAIVRTFGTEVVQPDGSLDRPALARLAFAGDRVEELNAIIHPATIALQAQRAAEVFDRQADAIVVIESALIFETKHGAGMHNGPSNESSSGPAWSTRFDHILLVTASEDHKIARFIARSGAPEDPAARQALAEEARRRLARMIPDSQKAAGCDFLIENDGSLHQLQLQVDAVWNQLSNAQP